MMWKYSYLAQRLVNQNIWHETEGRLKNIKDIKKRCYENEIY